MKNKLLEIAWILIEIYDQKKNAHIFDKVESINLEERLTSKRQMNWNEFVTFLAMDG